MSRNRFINAGATARLPLSDGDWIEVKEKLSYGEQQRLSTASLTSIQFGGDSKPGETEVALNMDRYALMRLHVWIVDWSFRDHNDKPVPVSKSAIDNLDPLTAEEINKALDEHIERVNEGKTIPTEEPVPAKK